VKNKKETEKNFKQIEDSLRYMIDEGFLKKVGNKYVLRSDEEIEKELKSLEENE
jgi:hypothetical protein